MKVTKLIREYVEEQVSKVYDAKVNPYAKQAEIDLKTIEEFEEQLRSTQQEQIDKFLSEFPLFNSYTREPTTRKAYAPNFTYDMSQAMQDKNDWDRENTKQKKAKVRDIIIALELGANRQELNDMIEKLMDE